MITHSAYGRSTFKLYRRVQNEYDFLVRDIDRQPVALGGDLVFHVWDDSGTSVISLPLTIHNPDRGHYRVIIPAADTAAIRSGLYVWGVTNDAGGVSKLLYTNQDYGAHGIVDVTDGIPTRPDEPVVVEFDDMTPLDDFRYTGAFNGAAADNPTGNHTMVAYLEEYTGDITIQGTTDGEIPVDDSGWIDIEIVEYQDATGTLATNFVGNFTYVRFLVSDSNGMKKLAYRN